MCGSYLHRSEDETENGSDEAIGGEGHQGHPPPGDPQAYSAEEKIRIVLDGLRGEGSMAPCAAGKASPRACITNWSKEFLEAGKKWLAGDTARAATTDEVKMLRRETRVI